MLIFASLQNIRKKTITQFEILNKMPRVIQQDLENSKGFVNCCFATMSKSKYIFKLVTDDIFIVGVKTF